MGMKVKVTIGYANEFKIEGDITFSEIKPLLDAWIAAVPAGDQAAIDAVTARLKKDTDKLAGAVQENTPPPAT